MIPSLFLIPLLGSLASGSLCGLLGFFMKRLNLSTASFMVAHAALAGAAIAMILALDQTLLAVISTLAAVQAISLLGHSNGGQREALSMSLFSLFNSIALLSIYFSNTTVLATFQLSSLLWGSVLALTFEKLLLLLTIFAAFFIYLTLNRRRLDSMLFDLKLAEAEGVDVMLHLSLLLIFIGLVVSFSLQLVGGFLVFSLLYNPVTASTQLTKNASKQQLFSPILGGSSAFIGFLLSYLFNLPVGATISITSVTVVLLAFTIRASHDRIKLKKTGNLGVELFNTPIG